MAKTAVEDTALATREERSGELQRSGSESRAQAEVQASIAIAKRFPRNELDAYGKAMESMKRPSMADMATYRFPRGGKQIEGPTVYLMRELARVWGNIDHGFVIVEDDEDYRQIRAIAWDLESNTRVVQDAVFKKLIQRKVEDVTQWVKPDERDLRELTNRQGAMAERNCIKHVLPSDLTEDAIAAAKETVRQKVSDDPAASQKNIVKTFGSLGIGVESIESYLGHSLKECDEDDLVSLRQIIRAIRGGDAKWSDFSARDDPKTIGGDVSVDDLTGARVETPAEAMANEPESSVATKDDDMPVTEFRLDRKAIVARISQCADKDAVLAVLHEWTGKGSGDDDLWLESTCEERLQAIKEGDEPKQQPTKRKANGKQQTAFDKGEG